MVKIPWQKMIQLDHIKYYMYICQVKITIVYITHLLVTLLKGSSTDREFFSKLDTIVMETHRCIRGGRVTAFQISMTCPKLEDGLGLHIFW